MHCASIVLALLAALRAGGYEFSHIFSRFASTSNDSNASTIIVLFTQSISYRVASAYNKKGSQIDIAVLDFSKAFDTVQHDGLLSKLKHYGIDDKIWTWISNFLKQRVVVDGIQSDLVTVDSGVLQGTVLGPILFLLHINDLPSVISSKVRLFADDCLVYREIKSRQDQNDLQKDLNLLESWGLTWGMRFNAAKCNIMRVSIDKHCCSYMLMIN